MIDLNKIQRNVLAVIQRNPNAANDDALLLERYWVEIENWDDTKSLYWNLSHVTRPATIERRRRELHSLGLIQYSDEADKERMEAFKNERDKVLSPMEYAEANYERFFAK